MSTNEHMGEEQQPQSPHEHEEEHSLLNSLEGEVQEEEPCPDGYQSHHRYLEDESVNGTEVLESLVPPWEFMLER